MMRKLEDSSWLAQTIKDKMDIEFDKNNEATTRWHCLQTLRIIINEADNKDNDNISYDNYNGRRAIVIRDIPSMMEHGTDFDRDGMRCKLQGLAAKYTDSDGNYIVSVKTTHDLNSAVIKDISELLHSMAS